MADGYSDKERNPLRAAQEELNTAQENLLEKYLKELKKGFIRLPIFQKGIILHNLEKLVANVEQKYKDPSYLLKRIEFDPLEAKRIREEEGLNQHQLAKQVGLSQAQLCRYERGEQKRPTHNRKIFEMYVQWLIEHGYTPTFKL